MNQLLCALLVAASLRCGNKLRTVDEGVSASPAMLAFGTAAAGSTQELRLRVTNMGIGTLALRGVRVAADPLHELAVADLLTSSCDGAPRSRGLTLLAGECAQLAVRWTPSSAHEAQGAIEIESDDAAAPALTIPISGSATAPALQVCVLTREGAVDPAACSDRGAALQNLPQVDFGAGVVASTATRTVRLSNTGRAPLELTAAPRMAAGTPADFVVSAAAPGWLAPGASVDLQLQATPASAGSLRGALELSTNDPLAANVQVPLLMVVNGWKLCAVPDGGLDFGAVTVGQSQTLTLTFSNCGDADFAASSFALDGASPTAQEFSVPPGELPALPLALKPGARFSLDVTYRPSLPRRDRASFEAVFQVPGGQAAGSWPLRGEGAAPAPCSTPPVARIAASRNTAALDPAQATLAPLDLITLNGAASTAPNGGKEYAWRLLGAPATANDALQGGGEQVKLQVRQAGDYRVELTVKDAQGCVSAPAVAPLHVVPLGAVHVELTWAESFGDLDLHYVGPGGALYQDSPRGDLDWRSSLVTAYGAKVTATGNSSPDWGLGNTVAADGYKENDPTLDVDQQWGNGPENVTHQQPFDGTYQVVVHYYCGSAHDDAHNPSQGNATATVRVWVDGVLRPGPAPSAVLRPYQLWTAATVVVSNRGRNVEVSYPPEPPRDTNALNCSNWPSP